MTSVIQIEQLPTEIKRGSLISINTNRVTPLTHGFHKYPGKFIPQIPSWAIDTYLKDKSQIVLDPFVGSGTTLVEATAKGYDSFGSDIDPLSCLISKVKSTPLDPYTFKKISDWLLSDIHNTKKDFEPKTNNLNHWFTNEATEKLIKIRTRINKLVDEFSEIENIEDYFDSFIIAFSGIIRRVSNADNQSQKTYVSGTKIKKPAEAYLIFTKQLGLFYEGYKSLNDQWNGKAKSTIIHSSGSPDFPRTLSSNVDLIITSPPYIKSIDYVYNQMVELFWVGDLFEMDTQIKQNKKRKLYAGTTLVPKKIYENYKEQRKNLEIEELEDNIVRILKDEKNGEKHAFIVNKYFDFMDEHFKSSSKVLKPGAHYVMAVGNSTVSNIEVKTSNILIELAEKHNLYLENRWSYLIKNHFMGFDRGNKGGKITEDHMLIFKKG